MLPGLAPSHPLTLQREALGNPLWQGVALHRLNLHSDAKTLQRAVPGAALGQLVQTRQHDHGQCGIIVTRLLGKLLQGDAAILAGLA